MPGTGWNPVLVAVDVFFGPYPAFIPAHPTSGASLRPRFSYDVARRISDDTLAAAMETGSGPIMLLTGDQILSATVRDGAMQPGRTVSSDADGMYALDAPAGQWAVVDSRLARDDDCECGSCRCPQVCAACAVPVGGGHAAPCVWRRGSAPWEQPAVAAAQAVLEAHRHQPGCPLVRRRPGPLFLPGHATCQFCGTIGRQSAHTLTGGRTMSHHQRCLHCNQVWFAHTPPSPQP